MKVFLAGIAFLASIICQNEATPDGEIADLYLQSRKIRSSVQLYRTQYIIQETQKFDDVAEFFREDARRSIENIINYIGEGHNATCEKSLKLKLDEAQRTLFMALDDCMKRALPDWKTGRAGWNIDHMMTELVTAVGAFEAKIDKIRDSCFDHNSGIFEECLKQYLPELRQLVESYESEEATVRSRVQIKTGLGFINFGIYFNQSNDDFTNRTTAAMEEAVACIKHN